VVEDLSDGSEAVLKTLRYPDSKQARRRMLQEVTNLKLLSTVDCAVPRLLDDNTADFADRSVDLYMVMEYAKGQTLQGVVTERGRLSLETSIELVRGLTKNVVVAHKEGILHRDLKPANVVVRGLQPVALTIVDFGLSFNQHQDDPGTTKIGEFIDNRFLSLPEGRAPGGDQRDARSDITCIAGILFYCLTGTEPVVLRDGQERPPHRRDGANLATQVAEPRQLDELRALFDRAFVVSVTARFQSGDELETRLASVLKPGAERTTISVEEFAKETGQLLLMHDRKTQLAKYGNYGRLVLQSLEKRWKELRGKLLPFEEAAEDIAARPLYEAIDAITEFESLKNCQPVVLHLALQNTRVRGCIEYIARAVGDECIVYRASAVVDGSLIPRAKGAERRAAQQLIQPWTAVYRFRGLNDPDSTTCLEDLDASLVRIMEAMRNIPLGPVLNR
jgi:serine/threonine-protein kinase